MVSEEEDGEKLGHHASLTAKSTMIFHRLLTDDCKLLDHS